MGVYFFFRKGCRECHHPTSDETHDLCRSHAYCARGYQYHGAICATCEDLWERAQDLSNPRDAVSAFKALSSWIKGFRKNSKFRPKGQDHFYDPEERVRFQDLFAKIAKLRSASPARRPQVRPSRPRRPSPLSGDVPPSTPPRDDPSPHQDDHDSGSSSGDSDVPSNYVPSFAFVGSSRESDDLEPVSSDSDGKRKFGFSVHDYLGMLIL